MRLLLVIIASLFVYSLVGQTTAASNAAPRKGLVFGIGLGLGALQLNTSDTTKTSFSTTLPNIKLGYMLKDNLALLLLLPGANYKYQGKDRGFEAFVLAGQFWIKHNWWVLSGTGLSFDAPAFYTVKDPKTAGFYAGLPALTFATGYEIWHKNKFALDLHYRFFIGRSNLPNGQQRRGFSNMLLLGFNWY